MSIKNTLRWFIVVGFLVLVLATPKPALALSVCGGSYVAEAGETLQSIAARCGTSVEAIRQANPNVGDVIYGGQTLWLPGGYQAGGINYGDQYGGTYSGYQGGSNCYSYQSSSNCYGYQNSGNCYGYQNSSNCYGYQDGGNSYGNPYTVNAYASYGVQGSGTYVVQLGDTMRIIADRLGIPLSVLIAANPQIWNPSLIYPGQVICLPSYNAQPAYYNPQPAYYPRHFGDGHPYRHEDSTTLYTIQHGDTLKSIAKQFGTTVDSILELNPTIKRPSRIHAGQVIRIW